MLENNSISIEEYSKLDRQRCAAYTATLIALCKAYDDGRISHIRRKELERQLRAEWKSVHRPDRIRGFIAWTEKIRGKLDHATD